MAENDPPERPQMEPLLAVPFKQPTETDFISEQNAKLIPREYARFAVNTFAEDLTIMWDYLKDTPQAQQDVRFQHLMQSSVQSWLDGERYAYQGMQDEDVSRQHILDDLATMLDAAIEITGPERALRLLQIGRIKQAAIQAERRKDPNASLDELKARVNAAGKR